MTTKDEVKALWKLCFTDSDEFTDLYFDLRYKDDINMAVREEGKSFCFTNDFLPDDFLRGDDCYFLRFRCVHPSRLQVAWSHAAIVEADASSHV